MFSTSCGVRSYAHPDEDTATIWQGKLWYIRTWTERKGGEDRARMFHQLVNVSLKNDIKPDTTCYVPLKDRWSSRKLLPGTDRLWICSIEGTGYFKNGEIYLSMTCEPLPHGISRFFLYQGYPTVIQGKTKKKLLKSFIDGSWQVVATFDLKAGETSNPDIAWMEVVVVNDVLHLFQNIKNILYYCKVSIKPESVAVGSWEILSRHFSYFYCVSLLGANPVIFDVESKNNADRIFGFMRKEGVWRKFWTYTPPDGICDLGTGLQAATTNQHNVVYLFYANRRGICHLKEVDKGGIKKSYSWQPVKNINSPD